MAFSKKYLTSKVDRFGLELLYTNPSGIDSTKSNVQSLSSCMKISKIDPSLFSKSKLETKK